MPTPLTGDCQACPLNTSKALNLGPTSYRGPLNASVVVLGQSPGDQDVRSGLPFTGPSGTLVNDALYSSGFKVDNVLWYNTVQCQPRDGQKVDLSCIEACSSCLNRVIKSHPRQVVLALGNEAWAACHDLRRLSGVRAGCGRTAWSDRFGCWTVWAVHPAFVLRSPGWAGEFEHAFKRAYRLCTSGEPERPTVVQLPHSNEASLVSAFAAVNSLEPNAFVAFDIETAAVKHGADEYTGNYQNCPTLGMSLAWRPSPESHPNVIYIPFCHTAACSPCWSKDQWAWISSKLDRLMSKQSIRWTAQNGKFDGRYLIGQYGLPVRLDFDTMVAHKLIDENKPHGLKWMARNHLDAPDWDIMDGMESGKHLGHLPLDDVAEYCCYDAAYTLELAELFDERLVTEKLDKLFYRLDMPVFRLLMEMELEGMEVDTEALTTISDALLDERRREEVKTSDASGLGDAPLPYKVKSLSTKYSAMLDEQLDKLRANPELGESKLDEKSTKIEERYKKLYETAYAKLPKGVNPSSHPECQYVIYEHFAVTFPSDTKMHLIRKHSGADGKPRTGKATLDWLTAVGQIGEEHPAWKFICGMRRTRSLKTLHGYIEGGHGIRHNVYPDGKVHPDFGFNGKSAELASPVTGRLSCNSPNVQNVKKWMRPVYVAGPGNVFIESDYGALEVRIWAYMSQDPALFAALASGDFHTSTAAAALRKDPSDVTKDERAAAKVAIFGTIYGGGSSTLSRTFGWSKARADELLDAIFTAYPRGKAYLDSAIESAKRYGYVSTIFGRRRRIPEIRAEDDEVRANAERQALNSPIQGGASELCNLASVRLAPALREEYGDDPGPRRVCIVNNVHDMLLVRCPEEVAEEVQALVEQVMTQPPFPAFNVPLVVDQSYHTRWGGDLDISGIRVEDEIDAVVEDVPLEE